MLDDLPDMGIYGKGFHFLESEKKYTVGNFFPYTAKSHKAFPRVSILQTEKNVKIQFARSHFFSCGFYVSGSET
jgi:hypothetical protein